ncbi:hypothetical protein [Pseudolysinimonas sp.]
MSDHATFASMRWRIMRHGPHDERGFGLIAGLIAAAGVVVLAVLVRTGAIEESWFVLGFSSFTTMWLLGPLLMPGMATPMNPQWFRTLPHAPWRTARALATSEVISVGALITSLALSSVVIVASPAGVLGILIGVIAAVGQLWLLLWLGRCTSVLMTALLRTRVGVYIGAAQLSVILALSFAGWVPVAALALPGIGAGDTAFAGFGSLLALIPAVEAVLLALPTAWSLAAVNAVTASAPLAALPWILALFVAAGALRTIWIAVTADALRRPQSHLAARPFAFSKTAGGPVRGVVFREVKTWLRDPHRKLELGIGWSAPVLMIALIAPTNWTWALPFVGIPAAAISAMIAVNTYALDGTAIWQTLTTPRAPRADVIGRQLAWMLLFGAPTIVLTVLLCLVSQSPLSFVALGMTLAATGAACGIAPLLSLLMPAIGADARDRHTAADNAGNPAGGQWTALPAVAAASLIPAFLAPILSPIGSAAVGLVLGVALALIAPMISRRMLAASGPRLIAAVASGDTSRLREA